MSAVLESPDPPLAQDNLAIPLSQQVIGCSEPLGHSTRESSLEDNRALALADLGEQREVLHISSTDLKDIGIFGYQADVMWIENFGDHGYVALLSYARQQLQTSLCQPLIAKGGGSRFEGS